MKLGSDQILTSNQTLKLCRPSFVPRLYSVAVWQSLLPPVPAQSDLKPPSERSLAPDFNLKDESGKDVKLSDLKGKVVLVNFWATWCEGCQVEVPWFVEFQKEYASRGLVVVGIS